MLGGGRATFELVVIGELVVRLTVELTTRIADQCQGTESDASVSGLLDKCRSIVPHELKLEAAKGGPLQPLVRRRLTGALRPGSIASPP